MVLMATIVPGVTILKKNSLVATIQYHGITVVSSTVKCGQSQTALLHVSNT